MGKSHLLVTSNQQQPFKAECNLCVCPNRIQSPSHSLTLPVVFGDLHPFWYVCPGPLDPLKESDLEFRRIFLPPKLNVSILTSWVSAGVDLMPLTFLLSGLLPLQTTLSPPWRLNLMMIGWMSGLRGSEPVAAPRLGWSSPHCMTTMVSSSLWEAFTCLKITVATVWPSITTYSWLSHS